MAKIEPQISRALISFFGFNPRPPVSATVAAVKAKTEKATLVNLPVGIAEQNQLPIKLKMSTKTQGEQAQARPECSHSNRIVNN